MGGVAPTPAPNLENELAKLANAAIEQGGDPRDVTNKLRTVIQHLRQNPELAAHATNALADGVATPADISRKVYEHALHPVGIDVQEPADLTEGTRAALPDYMRPMPSMSDVLHNLENVPQRAMAAVRAGGRRLGADFTSASQNIPGMKALEAKGRSVVQGEPYAQAYNDVGAIADEAPKTDRVVGDVAMAAAMSPVLPESPALAGAIYGGASQALSGEPGLSAGQRGLRTAIGTAGGAVLGKLAGAAATRLRALASKNYPAESFLMKDLADKTNDANYGAALAAGAQRQPTPIVQQLLANPDFSRLADNLKASPQFRGMAETDPRFLNEVYKSLSDIETGVRKGLAQLNPSKPNTKRVELGDVALLKQQLLSALGSPDVKPPLTFNVPQQTHTVQPVVTATPHEQAFGPPMAGGKASIRRALKDFPNPPSDVPAFNLKANPGHVQPGVSITTPAMRVQTAPAQPMPAYMPEYAGAVDVARQGKAEARAFDLGYDATRANAHYFNRPMARGPAKKFSADAIRRYVSDPNVSDEEKQRIVQGVLAAVKQAPTFGRPTKILGTPVIPHLSHELRSALPLMRAAGAPNQAFADFLTKLGVLSTEAPFAK